MSTLTEVLSREHLSTQSGHLCTFLLQCKKRKTPLCNANSLILCSSSSAKIRVTATSFPSIPWSSSSIYSLRFFFQGLSHLEATAFQERPVLLEKAPSSSLHPSIFFLAGRKQRFCTSFTFSHQFLSYDMAVRNMFSSEISF